VFRTRTAGSAPAVDSGGRSYPRGGAVGHSRGSGAAMGTLARVVHLIVGIVVLIIVAEIVLVLLKANQPTASSLTFTTRLAGSPARSTAFSASTARGSRCPSIGASPRSSTPSSAD
jgi:hypothetical protein